MPEADETIITRFIVQTADAVADAERYREEIDRIKKAVLDMSVSQKVALKDLEVQWVKLAKAQKESAVTKLKQQLPSMGVIDTAGTQARVKELEKQYDEMISHIRTAFKEAQAEEKKFFAEQATIGKQLYKEQAEEAKASAKSQTDAIKNKVAIQKELERQVNAELKVQYKEAAQFAAEYARITQQGYGIMSVGAQTYGAQVQAIKQQIQQLSAQSGQSFQQVANQLKEAGVPTAQINQALKELNVQTKAAGQGFRLFGQEIKNVGDLAKAVFLGIFGISVVTILRNVVRSLGEAAKAGYEFGKAIFQLEVGARALQRAGVDVTIEQIYGQLSTLQERFKIFTTRDLVVGTAAFLNLNRDMGFTREQLFKLQDAIATLAVVNGRAMDEVQRTVALALSSGYTEGLQRLGVSINRVNIANEAGRIGFAKAYMALTEQQRALATYNLVIQKTAIYQEDLQKYFDTAPGAVDRTKTEFQELKNQFELILATNLGTYLRDINRALDLINERIEEFKKKQFSQSMKSINDRFAENIEKLKIANPLLITFVEWITKLSLIKAFPSPFDQILASLFRMLGIKEQLDEGILGDEAVGETERQAKKIEESVSEALENLEEFEKEFADKVRDIEADYLRDIEKLERDAGRRRLELARDLARDLAEIERDGLQDREDLQRDYFDTLRKIGEGLARDIAEETAKYNMAVAQTIRDFAIRRQEAEARYRENEIKAEIRFQEDMRRLREGFLFDLEDALHERDARQVLRLIRQYNLQKTQAERQFEIERDERRRAFELEMQELETQRQERLRILAEEHAARLASIQEQAAYERELARRKYEEDKAELARKLEEEKQERIAKALEAEEELARRLEEAKTDRKALLDQQIADLNAERDRLLQEMGEKLWGAVQLTTSEGLKQLYDALIATLGEGGDADKVFQYYVASAKTASAQVAGELAAIAVAMSAIAALAAQISGVSEQLQFAPVSIPGAGGAGAPTPNPRQFGGEVYKGEIYNVHKDEKFVPAMNGRILSAQQSQEAVAQAFSGTGRGSSEGKVKIGIALSEGLVGEIIDKAGDAVAEVVFELERKRN